MNKYDEIFHNAYWAPELDGLAADDQTRKDNAWAAYNAAVDRDNGIVSTLQHNPFTFSQSAALLNIGKDFTPEQERKFNLKRFYDESKNNPEKTIGEFAQERGMNDEEAEKFRDDYRNYLGDIAKGEIASNIDVPGFLFRQTPFGQLLSSATYQLHRALPDFVPDPYGDVDNNSLKEGLSFTPEIRGIVGPLGGIISPIMSASNVSAKLEDANVKAKQDFDTSPAHVIHEEDKSTLEKRSPEEAQKHLWEKANDVALYNMYKTGNPLASKIGKFDDYGNVTWTSDEERDQETKDYLEKEKGLQWYYDNNIKTGRQLFPLLSESDKDTLLGHTPLAGGWTGYSPDAYFAQVVPGLTKEDTKNAMRQAFAGPGADYGFNDKDYFKNVITKDENGENIYTDNIRQDNENYGDLFKDGMYNGQDVLMFLQGYNPNTGKIYDALNSAGLTKGEKEQPLEGWLSEHLDEQPLTLSELYKNNPANILKYASGGSAKTLNDTTGIMTNQLGISPLVDGQDKLKDQLSQLLQKGKTASAESILKNVAKKYDIENSSSQSPKDLYKHLSDSFTDEERQEAKDNNSLMQQMFNEKLPLNRGMLNSIIIGSDMAQRGTNSELNPDDYSVKNYLNFYNDKNTSTNYTMPENSSLDSTISSDALAQLIATPRRDLWGSEDNYANPPVDTDALALAFNRAKRKSLRR